MGINKFKNSKLELWDNKFKKIVEKPKKNKNDLSRGLELEDYIAKKFAEKQGLKIKKIKVLAVCDELKICSSFDYLIEDKPNMIFEIKTFDPFGFKESFTVNDEGTKLLSMPNDYELQIQHQLLFRGLFGAEMARLGVASGYADHNFLSLDREPSKAVQDEILKKVAEFWKSIEDGKRPEPDYNVDCKYVQSLLTKADKGTEMVSTPETDELALAYKDAHELEKKCTKNKEKLRTQLMEKLGKNEKCLGAWGHITANYHPEKTVIVPATEEQTKTTPEKRGWSVTFKK